MPKKSTKSQSTVAPILVDTKTAAKLLACSPWTIRLLAVQGALPVARENGRSWRFKYSDLEAYANAAVEVL
jgi:excisionase family DNA binding protein